jgi:xylulokinase
LRSPGPWAAGKILSFKKEDPKGFQQTHTCFLVHNYVNWFLTGEKDGGVRVMEPGDTSGMALWNPETGAFSTKACNAISGDLIHKLPEVKPADEFIGPVSKSLAQKYGFPKNCMIDAGAGDNMYGAVGTGNVREGIVTVSLGTSGTACTIFKKPYCDPEGEIASYCDAFGNYMALLCVSNLANGYNKILKMHNLSHSDFSEIIGKTGCGNQGLVLIPWYTGERTPDMPDGAPLYFGFDLDDFSKEKLCRAVLEGHIMNLYEGFLKLPMQPDIIYLTGGIAQSAVWRQTIADIFKCTVMPVKGEGAALGAAIHAAYVDNKDSVQDLYAFVKQFIEYDEGNRTSPVKENVKIYEDFKQVYLALSKRIRGIVSKTDPFKKRKDLVI